MSRFKNYILQLSNNFSKNKGKGHIRRFSIAYEEVKHIGLVVPCFQPFSDHQAVKELISDLTKDLKKIQCLVLSEKEAFPDLGIHYLHLEEKDFKYFGNIRKDEVKNFLEYPFDYLLVMSLEWHPMLEYVLLHSGAHCRVGRHFEEKENCLDLMFEIKMGETLEELAKNTITYIKKLSGKKTMVNYGG